MRFAFLLASLLAAAVAPGAPAADEGTRSPTSDSSKSPPAKEAPAEKLVQLGVIRGVVKEALGPGGELTLRVRVRYLEPNVKAQAAYLQQYRQLLAREQAVLNNPNTAQRLKQMQQLAQQAQQLKNKEKDLYQVKEKETTVEMILPEDAKVRVSRPPNQFDDKGNVKTYTPQELKELKGPGKLAGYTGSREDIQPGQTVVVKAARKVALPAIKSKEGDRSSGAKPAANPPKPLALIVLIAGEPK